MINIRPVVIGADGDYPKDFTDDNGFEHSFFDDEDVGLYEHITFNNITYAIEDEKLSDIAFEGKCMIYSGKPDMFFTNGTYISPILTNPTNADLMKIAYDYVVATGETSHFILEGLFVKGKMIGCDIHECDLVLGS